MYVFTNPSGQAECDTKSTFKFNRFSDFPSLRLVAKPRLKNQTGGTIKLSP